VHEFIGSLLLVARQTSVPVPTVDTEILSGLLLRAVEFTICAMRTIGRFLQLVGLIVLPASMFLELAGGLDRAFGVSEMVVMLVFGVAAFGIGRLVEGYAGG
jgi:hypothetical protein